MKAWDKMWQKFDEAFDLMPKAMDEMLDTLDTFSTKVTIHEPGHVTITGKIESLHINGFLVRVPNHVMFGTVKPGSKSNTKGV